MSKKYFYVSLLMLVILGCQTIELSQEAKQVRTISPAVAEKCQHLGLVNAFEIYLVGGIEAAQLNIRNQAAKLGGNSILIVSENIDKHKHAKIIAEVYRCSFESK